MLQSFACSAQRKLKLHSDTLLAATTFDLVTWLEHQTSLSLFFGHCSFLGGFQAVSGWSKTDFPIIEYNWDQLVTPPYFAADEDLILAVSCKTNELRQPFGSSFEITEVAEAAAAEITGLFSQPVWITASPLTCSGLVKPEHQREKWFLGPGPSVTVVERMNLSPPLQHSLWFPRGL